MKFSVIIPVYNIAPYLRECLRSVIVASDKLKAINDKWATEIICVDDGSTDGSSRILDEIVVENSCSGRKEEDSNINLQLQLPTTTIKVIHQKNQGVSAARNRGLEESSGEWILFLDGDDVWHPEIFKVCSEMIESTKDADLLSFSRIRFPENEQPKWMPIIKDCRTRDLTKGILQEDLQYGFWTFAYRKDVAMLVRFPPYVVGEDIIYRACCLNLATRIVKTKNVLLAYRTRKSSVSNTHLTYKKYVDRIKYLIQWLCLTLTSSRPQPKGLAWRLIKDIARAIVVFK